MKKRWNSYSYYVSASDGSMWSCIPLLFLRTPLSHTLFTLIHGAYFIQVNTPYTAYIVIFIVHYRTAYTQPYCFNFVAVQWTTVNRYLLHMYVLISSSSSSFFSFIRFVRTYNFDYSLLSENLWFACEHLWIHFKYNKTNRANEHFIWVWFERLRAHTNLDILTHQ